LSLTAADLARSQAEMWAQRVAEAEAALCRTTEPRALRAAIAAHEQHEADWQANRRTDAYVKLESLAQRQAAQQETVARRAAEQRAADRREAERWAAALARQEAVQQAAQAVLAQAEAARLAKQAAVARQAAHATSEAARVALLPTLHNGAWRGWGGLSPSERAETGARASNHWATDIDDTDGWTEHVIDSHLDLIPASRLYLSPRMGHYYGHGDYGDARE
jgi:membrane protein involved in colicin uptake